MTRTSVRLAALGVVVGLALSGCGGAVRGGAAAVVGGSRIPTTQLADIVSAGLADPAAQQLAGDRPAYQRNVLESLIQGRLVERTAARLGVNVTQGQADAEYAAIEEQVGGPAALPQQAAAAGLSLDRVRDLARTRALSQAIADRLTQDLPVSDADLRAAYQQGADTFDQVRTAQILLPTLADAQALLPTARTLDNAAFEALARTRSTDQTTAQNGGDLGLQPRSAFEQNGLTDYATAAFDAAVGDTFAVASPRGGHLVRVLERRTVSLPDATPQLRRTVLGQQRNQALSGALRETADGLGISVNPRFGRWDASALSVAAAEEGPERGVSAPPQAPAAGPAPAS